MKRALLLLLLCSSVSFAQETIPSGTILPVQLNSSVRSDKVRPNQVITARIMQDVPLPGHARIPAGAKVIGHVVEARPASPTQKAEVTLRFDTVVVGKQHIPVTTNLRALASMMDVEQAQVPESGPDRGTPEYWWTTDQIGGQVNYHGNGLITENGEVVGHSTGEGVLARPCAVPGTKCRGEFEGNQLQALWVFSSTACGLYDYPHLVLKHAGRTDPLGQIELESEKGDVNLRSGSGMLLRVIGPEQ